MSKTSITKTSKPIGLKDSKLQVTKKSSRLITIVRWWLVGLFFTGINVPILYIFVDIFNLPLTIASLIAAELSTIWRFFLNDRWVFGHRRPTWQRFYQYHLASLSSSILWVIVTNLLPSVGINYTFAAIIASAISVLWSMITNFFWVWKSGKKPQERN